MLLPQPIKCNSCVESNTANQGDTIPQILCSTQWQDFTKELPVEAYTKKIVADNKIVTDVNSFTRREARADARRSVPGEISSLAEKIQVGFCQTGMVMRLLQLQ